MSYLFGNRILLFAQPLQARQSHHAQISSCCNAFQQPPAAIPHGRSVALNRPMRAQRHSADFSVLPHAGGNELAKQSGAHFSLIIFQKWSQLSSSTCFLQIQLSLQSPNPYFSNLIFQRWARPWKLEPPFLWKHSDSCSSILCLQIHTLPDSYGYFMSPLTAASR